MYQSISFLSISPQFVDLANTAAGIFFLLKKIALHFLKENFSNLSWLSERLVILKAKLQEN